MARNRGIFFITTSRRTPDDIIDYLNEFEGDGVKIYNPKTAEIGVPNPYQQWLAHADRLIVTMDSINMMSEATMAERPIDYLPLSHKKIFFR